MDVLERDPVLQFILRDGLSVEQAEERYLDEHIAEVLRLVESSLTDEEFRNQPIIALLMSHGSRGREDSLW